MFLGFSFIECFARAPTAAYRLRFGALHLPLRPNWIPILSRYFPLQLPWTSTPTLQVPGDFSGSEGAALALEIELAIPGKKALAYRRVSNQILEIYVAVPGSKIHVDACLRLPTGWRSLTGVSLRSLFFRHVLLWISASLLGFAFWSQSVAAKPARPAQNICVGIQRPSIKQQLVRRQRSFGQLKAIISVLENIPQGSVWQAGDFDLSKAEGRYWALSSTPRDLWPWCQSQDLKVETFQETQDRHWLLELSVHKITAVNRSQNNETGLALAQFTEQWAPYIQRCQIGDPQVELQIQADLSTLLALVSDFPGVLMLWRFDAEETLSHHLVFEILSLPKELPQ